MPATDTAAVASGLETLTLSLIAEILPASKRRIVSQCQNQVAVVINAAALDSDTVLSVNAVLTVFSVRTVLAVSADDFTEIGNNAIGKRDNQIAVASISADCIPLPFEPS